MHAVSASRSGPTDRRALNAACLLVTRPLDSNPITINEIVKGKAAITPATALQFERALGAPADFWLARECSHREWLAREKAREDLKRWAGWLKELPLLLRD